MAYQDEISSLRHDIKDLHDMLDGRLRAIENDLFLYKGVIRFIRWVGAVIICVLAFRFGDIKNLQ